MRQAWRWFAIRDSVSLSEIRQVAAIDALVDHLKNLAEITGVASALKRRTKH